tara:strand:- start:680 stop:940 length:261 start_codon:yes stop_codon:yes gene_type:complete
MKKITKLYIGFAVGCFGAGYLVGLPPLSSLFNLITLSLGAFAGHAVKDDIEKDNLKSSIIDILRQCEEQGLIIEVREDKQAEEVRG